MDRWQQVEKLCQSALELEESRRAAFLEQACAGDKELRREVESLLRFDGRGDRFIEEPALELAAKMIAQDKPQSLLGQQLGSYQILSLLGAGGMGVVYQARDTRLKRSVAVKVLPAESVSDPERKRRFMQEARAASALNHPNIVTIYDIGSERGIDFVVMEYVTGKTLDQRIPRKGMRPNEAIKLAIQIADALAKAHSAGIVHRDLKPSNVMVTEEGLVKVLDFGLAKLTEVSTSGEGTTSTVRSPTEEGMIVGTLSYMSPEQAEGKKVDARSDIFSFGSVLYEMVSGQKAFEEDSKISTLAAIVKEEPKAISQLIPGIPTDLEKIINRDFLTDNDCVILKGHYGHEKNPQLKSDLEKCEWEYDQTHFHPFLYAKQSNNEVEYLILALECGKRLAYRLKKQFENRRFRILISFSETEKNNGEIEWYGSSSVLFYQIREGSEKIMRTENLNDFKHDAVLEIEN